MRFFVPAEYFDDKNAWGKFSNVEFCFSGDLSLLKTKLISIIGTRTPSKDGILRAKRLTKLLVKSGYTIVSGLALGIDSTVHTTALENKGNTIAVLPTPFDKFYPRENIDLKDEIENSGLVITQYKNGENVYKSNFAKRNLLMATISITSIVVEASEKSGTRHQIDENVKLNKMSGFLNSLANTNISWINNIIQNGYGTIIQDENDIFRLIENANLIRKHNDASRDPEIDNIIKQLDRISIAAAIDTSNLIIRIEELQKTGNIEPYYRRAISTFHNLISSYKDSNNYNNHYNNAIVSIKHKLSQWHDNLPTLFTEID